MENPVKFRGRANVVVYENNDVDVRIPEENPDLKHEKLSESKCGKLSRTQGKQPQLLMSIKTAADSPDPAYDLRREFEKIVKVLDPKASELTKISTKLKGRWLSRSDDLKIHVLIHALRCCSLWRPVLLAGGSELPPTVPLPAAAYRQLRRSRPRSRNQAWSR